MRDIWLQVWGMPTVGVLSLFSGDKAAACFGLLILTGYLFALMGFIARK
jgi:hypothetical protein